LKLKRLCGGAGKLKCKFEILVQVRKVEALMQFLGFEDWVQFVCKCSWEGYGGGEMLLLPPESQLLTLVVVLPLASDCLFSSFLPCVLLLNPFLSLT